MVRERIALRMEESRDLHGILHLASLPKGNHLIHGPDYRRIQL
ncbi:MAG: hypothetical protein ACTSQP_02315 [Promethearchaeota archaeon]